MGARLRVFLRPEEERTLYELRQATTVGQRVKDRAQVIRLNAQGLYVENIASYMHWNVQTVRDTIHRWRRQGLGGLWDASHPGAQRRWQEEYIEFVLKSLREEPRTYNSRQLSEKLEKERLVHLSPDRLRRILKKRGCDGSLPVRVIKTSKTLKNVKKSKLI
jgi:transposase